jgi:hypothetical protein
MPNFFGKNYNELRMHEKDGKNGFTHENTKLP